MRPQEFAPTVHRGCDRIRVDSIAVMLSVLLALAAVHQPHAQNGPRVSWTFPTASAPNPLKLNWFKEVPRDLGNVEGKNIGKNRAGKTGSTDKSGSQRCEMSPEEFAKFYPPLISWIRNTLTASAPGRKPSLPVVFRGCRSILLSRLWHPQKLSWPIGFQYHPYLPWA